MPCAMCVQKSLYHLFKIFIYSSIQIGQEGFWILIFFWFLLAYRYYIYYY